MTLTTIGAAALVTGGGARENQVAKKEEQEKGKFEVLTGFCIGDGVNVWPGDVIELTPEAARRWGGLELVVPTDKPVGPAKPNPNHRKAKIQNRDPKGLQNRDPQ